VYATPRPGRGPGDAMTADDKLDRILGEILSLAVRQQRLEELVETLQSIALRGGFAEAARFDPMRNDDVLRILESTRAMLRADGRDAGARTARAGADGFVASATGSAVDGAGPAVSMGRVFHLAERRLGAPDRRSGERRATDRGTPDRRSAQRRKPAAPPAPPAPTVDAWVPVVAAPLDEARPPAAYTVDGFLAESTAWTPVLADSLAAAVGIELTPEHWQLLTFARHEFQATGRTPNIQRLATGSGLGTHAVYALFPTAPARTIARIAGIPKPTGGI
jgi:TusE/DsrC/DsvC family sulfur relay protein